MRIVLVVLCGLLLVLQIQLWRQYARVSELRERVEAQQQENRRLAERNAALAAEVEDLREGLAAIEERARSELGLIRDGESFFLIVDPDELSAEDLERLRQTPEAPPQP
ncbi:MAG: cell division protein FtsB [Wenzhouxiangellaceae bacterium]